MKRIIDPLRKTGVVIGGRDRDQYAPLYIIGKNHYKLFIILSKFPVLRLNLVCFLLHYGEIILPL